ncbi:hypothetical protein BAE44_0011424, partial [Dichanthelium oligosanthes]
LLARSSDENIAHSNSLGAVERKKCADFSVSSLINGNAHRKDQRRGSNLVHSGC